MTNFHKLLLGLLFLLFYFNSKSQITLYSDNFESSTGWTSFGLVTPNSWVISNCTSFAGSKSAYISSGGTTNDCSPSGIQHYGYTNSSGATQQVILAKEINASCFTSMSIEAQVKIQGQLGSDEFEFVYSTNNGFTWTAIGSPLSNVPSYTLQTQNLPAILDGTTFYVGFRFTVNNSVIGAAAPSVDNFVLKGFSSDITNPTISCPSNSNQAVSNTCDFNLLDYTSLATANDNCFGLTIQQSPTPNTTVNANTLITLTATDWSGNSVNCAFTLTLIDTTKPTITCIPTSNVYADISCKGIVPDLIPSTTSSDNCTSFSNLDFIQIPAPGVFITAATNVLVFSTDEAGNTNSCFTHVGIIDTIAPTITCPPTQTVSSNDGCNHILDDFTGLATITDDCSITFSLSQNPLIGSNISAGSYTITLTGQDESGNASSCTFTANIVENTPPTIICPGNLTEPTNTSCEGTLQDYTSLVTAFDNCTSNNLITLSQNPALGFSFGDTTLVTITGVDLNGNSGSCTFNVIPIDQQGPVVTCITDTIVPMSAPCQLTIPNLVGSHSAIDNCSSINNLTFSQSPAAGTLVANPTYVTVTYEDELGNTGTCQTFIIPNDNIIPTITCPGTQSLDIGIQCTTTTPNFTPLAVVTDNCTSFSTTQTPTAGSIINSGDNLITLTVTDVAGNQASCQFIYDVTEFVSPTIQCSADLQVCNPLVDYISPDAQDNCLYQLVQTDNSGYTDGDIFPIGVTTQSYMVIDSSGNSSSCSFTVTVLEYPDTANILVDTIYLCDVYTTTLTSEATQSGTASWNVLSVGPTLSSSTANTITVSNLQIGLNKIEWLVSSTACGSQRDTAYIFVNTPPSPANLPDSLVVCGVNGFLIQGSLEGNGDGSWSSSTGVTFANPNSILTSVTSVPGIYSDIIWTINAGACGLTADTALLIAPQSANILTNDTTLCFEDLPFTIVSTQNASTQFAYWYSPTGNLELTNTTGNSVQIISAIGGTSNVILRLTDQLCGVSTDTVQIQLNFCTDISEQLPTMFTPNGDGQNDIFYFATIAQQYGPTEVTIINRYGAIVFDQSKNSDYWDGTYKNEPVPMGTYFYKIKSLNDSFETIEGSISIIR
jgi:gliding motility-associated-like protein